MKIPLAFLAMALLSQTIHAPFRTPSVPPVTNMLTADDLTFDGWIRLPAGISTSFSDLSGSGRYVGSDVHLFVGANHTSFVPPIAPTVYEIDVTGIAPVKPMASATRATLYSKWPDVTHGHYQSYNGSCTPSFHTAQDAVSTQVFFNPDNNLFYYLYTGNYSSVAYNMDISTLDTPDTTSGTSTFVGGPYRFSATDQYNSINRSGSRQSYIERHPLSGAMLIGGHGYFNNQKAWGPNLYRSSTWVTGSTSGGGGCGSAVVNIPEHLLAYYAPTDTVGVNTPNSFDGWTGSPTSTPIAQFNWPSSFLSYPFIRGGPTTSGGTRINPQTSNLGTLSQLSANPSLIGWFEGAHKRGVIYTLSPDANDTGETDRTACATAALSQYLNSGQGWVHFSGTPTGTWTVGSTVTGGTSGAKMQVYNHGYNSTNKGMEWIMPTGNFTVGETITEFPGGLTGVVTSAASGPTLGVTTAGSFTVGRQVVGTTSGKTMRTTSWTPGAPGTLVGNKLTVTWSVGETITAASGGSGVVDEFERHDTFDGGCACSGDMSCATGPSGNWQTPVMAIYNPDDLEAVAADTATDYLTQPTTMINLLTAPFSMTELYYNLGVRGNGSGPRPAGGWIDTVHLKLYTFWLSQDTGDNAIIGVFSINDSAAPAPKPVPISPYPMAFAALLTGWILVKESR